MATDYAISCTVCYHTDSPSSAQLCPSSASPSDTDTCYVGIGCSSKMGYAGAGSTGCSWLRVRSGLIRAGRCPWIAATLGKSIQFCWRRDWEQDVGIWMGLLWWISLGILSFWSCLALTRLLMFPWGSLFPNILNVSLSLWRPPHARYRHSRLIFHWSWQGKHGSDLRSWNQRSQSFHAICKLMPSPYVFGGWRSP